jgi:hypothetical protein
LNPMRIIVYIRLLAYNTHKSRQDSLGGGNWKHIWCEEGYRWEDQPLP